MAAVKPLRVLICGSRSYEVDAVMPALIQGLTSMYVHDGRRGCNIPLVVIHGAASGADSLAGDFAKEAGAEVIEFPADWKRHGKAAGPIRNQQMLDEGKPDCVIAFVDRPLDQSAGTRDMVGRARRAGLPVWTVEYTAAVATEEAS